MGLKLQLAGVGKWEKQLLGVVNEGNPAPAYSIVNVSDPGLLLEQPSDAQTLHIYNLVLPATTYQFDDVLTNPAGAAAHRLGVKLTVCVFGLKVTVPLATSEAIRLMPPRMNCSLTSPRPAHWSSRRCSGSAR